ncbi:thiamine-phosphate kinase [Parashewanella curva]|uniref:Thiamine-monophosphate kinase n=1 Tax=Parashewanella curva TaxID=2338552 RepID=A0A3L8PW68_9GAMM|nr:thiamine-phosphate kinase [Parashewanella curva]RLV59596.1 thiamine-phosphate kinase [Parashewanella curva]
MKEFQIIEKYFAELGPKRKDVAVGIGDDCALVNPAEGNSVAISCDTLVEGTHFLPSMEAEDLGYKSLAVNLSDLAAMGAEPAWMTLALTLPEIDETWLEGYCKGLYEISEYYGIALVGGDTTHGSKSLTLTVNGLVPPQMAMTRSGAKVGDWIYVTGTIGDSALGLDILLDKQQIENESYKDYLVKRHYRPTPRVLAGQAIRGIASSAIDLSDGLGSDINHINKASGTGARIDVDTLPLSEALVESVGKEQAIEYAISGGEDYELLFTVSDANESSLITSLKQTGVQFTKIGQITSGSELTFKQGKLKYHPVKQGFKHF